MSRGITRGWAAATLAGLVLAFGLSNPASGQVIKSQYGYCSPCNHPFYGYYPTCWRPWPAGWNSWNCGLVVAPLTPPKASTPAKEEEPERIPPPRPETASFWRTLSNRLALR
jgi:hypothetical protein